MPGTEGKPGGPALPSQFLPEWFVEQVNDWCNCGIAGLNKLCWHQPGPAPILNDGVENRLTPCSYTFMVFT